MIVHHLKCFGAEAGGGNAALVVENDDGSEAQRQAFARERWQGDRPIQQGRGKRLLAGRQRIDRRGTAT